MLRLINAFRIRKTSPIVLIFSLIFSVQIGFLSILPSELSKNESPDFTVFYSVIADRLASGEDFTSTFYFEGDGNDALPSDESGYFVTRWPPGHPVIIAVIYNLADRLDISRDKLVKITFLLLYAFASCLLYKISSIFFKGYIPFLSAIIWATYPFNLWITKQPNSEIPFLIFFFWSIYLFLIGTRADSTKYIIAASVLISISMLIRAVSILTPVIFVTSYVIYSIYKRNPSSGSNYIHIIKKSLIMIIVPFLITLPWEIILYNETGNVLPLASTGTDLIRVANMNILKPRPDGALIVSNDLKAHIASTLSHEERCSLISDYCDQSAPQIISKKTAYVLVELYWVKFKRAFYGVDTKRFEDEVTLIQWLYFIPALFGFVLSVRKTNTLILNIAIIGLSLYFLAINIIGLPLLRYMLPVFGLYSIYVAVTADWCLRKILRQLDFN